MSTLLVVPAVTTPVANAILGVDGVQLAVVWHLVTWATGRNPSHFAVRRVLKNMYVHMPAAKSIGCAGCLCLWVTTRGSPTATGYKHKDGGTYRSVHGTSGLRFCAFACFASARGFLACAAVNGWAYRRAA